MIRPKDKNPLALDAGALRHAISIQAMTTVQDAAGGPSPVWNVVLTTWAAISTVSQREVFQRGQGGSQHVAEVTHRVQIRWPGASIGIAGGMQVVFGARLFEVQTVENVMERNRVMNLMCVEINGAI